ncbi:MAG: hypothetical protein AAB565_00735, partial [Patescibacteria group bacterium]
MSFFFGQSKQRDYLVLDIGKEAVKALILKRQKEEVELLSSALEYFDDHNVSTINEEEIIGKTISEIFRKPKFKNL